MWSSNLHLIRPAPGNEREFMFLNFKLKTIPWYIKLLLWFIPAKRYDDFHGDDLTIIWGKRLFGVLYIIDEKTFYNFERF